MNKTKPCNTVLQFGAPLSGEAHPMLQMIEVASSLQIPGFQLIGLPGPEVNESRERVRAAIGASGFEFPKRRVVLNLSPASIRKRGTGADLSMALAILEDAREDRPDADEISGSLLVVAWGELGLGGVLKGAGQLTCAIYAAWEAGARALIVAQAEHGLALERLALLKLSGMIQVAEPPLILPARDLREAWCLARGVAGNEDGVEFLRHVTATVRAAAITSLDVGVAASELLPLPASTERTLGVASSGAHHLLLIGPRGTGKSHALDWLVALQPEPAPSTRVRRALIEELASNDSMSSRLAPVRRVSAYTRPAALLGSVAPWGVKPGEFSLAHGGLLLADEFPEWARDSREALREPLERGLVTLTRARHSVELPARFMLAANGNFCPCGGWPPHLPLPPRSSGRKVSRCNCSVRERTYYLSRISGPVLDRMDLVMVTAHLGDAEESARVGVRKRLAALREDIARTQERLKSTWGELPSRIKGSDLERMIRAEPRWAEALDPSKFASFRTRHKVLRVALTLAAWDGQAGPLGAHFTEATLYRPERYGLAG